MAKRGAKSCRQRVSGTAVSHRARLDRTLNIEEQIQAAADRYEAEIRAAGARYEAAMRRILAACQPEGGPQAAGNQLTNVTDD
jgi:hypothetical protein